MDLYLGATLKAEVLVYLNQIELALNTQDICIAGSPPQTESSRLRIETSVLSEDPTPYYRFIGTYQREALVFRDKLKARAFFLWTPPFDPRIQMMEPHGG